MAAFARRGQPPLNRSSLSRFIGIGRCDNDANDGFVIN